MTRETYKGRKLKVVKGEHGGLVGSINGQPMPTEYGVTAEKIIAQFHRDIDLVDERPIDGGSGEYMYAPGTYELCAEGHAKAIGGACRHSYCRRATNAA
jgi:hypothetical protein